MNEDLISRRHADTANTVIPIKVSEVLSSSLKWKETQVFKAAEYSDRRPFTTLPRLPARPQCATVYVALLMHDWTTAATCFWHLKWYAHK